MKRNGKNKVERRTFHNVEVRESKASGPNGRPVITLRAVKPYVVDDYGSMWLPTTFDKAITERMAADEHDTPSLCWSHDWSDPIAHGITYEASGDGPVIGFELDDFAAVPRARQAHAQVQSKTIRDCSVGFVAISRRDPNDDERAKYPGIEEVIEEADLDEVSLVLRGAVPGAKVVGMRAGKVDFDAFIEIAKRKAAGDLTDDEARVALDLLEESDDGGAGGGNDGGQGAPPAAEDFTELDAEADELLESLGRSARR